MERRKLGSLEVSVLGLGFKGMAGKRIGNPAITKMVRL
jgi:hypothetical protein